MIDYIMFIITVSLLPNGDEDVSGTTFYDGVCFEYVYDDGLGVYIVTYDNIEYHVAPEYVIRTNRLTRSENVSYDEYRSIKHNDSTTDYIKTVKEVIGIDMKVNYAPQFRDGVNPFKDGNTH
jgi:hypothetical protein